MNYAESIQYLHQLGMFGARFGLETSLKLAGLAGNPQNALRFIHVAGTNGKGSTCAMLESIYRAAGLRVGLYTSPHLVSFRERIQINRKLISKEDVVRLVNGMKDWMPLFPVDGQPTFFEFVTIMALRYFAEQQCDLVIWETGLGGRLDATNIVIPLASVITNIQFDHEKWLGSTLAAIASEKAGIIKPGVPVFTGENHAEPLAVIRARAAEQKSSLTVVKEEDTFRSALVGRHQERNAALAVRTVLGLNSLVPVDEAQIRNGLSAVSWPGRFQIVQRDKTIWILDGAHNPAGAKTLIEALAASFPGVKPVMILGMMKDKDWPTFCRLLSPLAGRIYLCPVASERSAMPQDLLEACRRANPSVEIMLCANFGDAVTAAGHASCVLVTGSLHFLGEAMERLGLIPDDNVEDERMLNEWGATNSVKTLNAKITSVDHADR